MNTDAESVGPWELAVSRDGRCLLTWARMWTPGNRGSVTVTGAGQTPAAAIANAAQSIDPIAGDLAGDIADTFARMFDELEAAAAPPADTVVDRFERWKAAGCPLVDERGLYLEQGPTDI